MNIIRPVRDSDAPALATLGRKVLDDSSTLHLLRPGETLDSIEEQRDLIHFYQAAPNRCMLVAEAGPGELAGQITAFGGTYTADQGTAVLIVEVAPDWRRRRFVRRWLLDTEAWAVQHGVHRLELTVLVENTPALKLYEKCGYLTEGRKKASRRINHVFHDEFIMAKLLPPLFGG